MLCVSGLAQTQSTVHDVKGKQCFTLERRKMTHQIIFKDHEKKKKVKLLRLLRSGFWNMFRQKWNSCLFTFVHWTDIVLLYRSNFPGNWSPCDLLTYRCGPIFTESGKRSCYKKKEKVFIKTYKFINIFPVFIYYVFTLLMLASISCSYFLATWRQHKKNCKHNIDILWQLYLHMQQTQTSFEVMFLYKLGLTLF